MQINLSGGEVAAVSGGLVIPNQAASILQVNERTLANWRVTGHGPRFVKIGSRVRYRLCDLNAYIEGNTFDNTAAASAGKTSVEAA